MNSIWSCLLIGLDGSKTFFLLLLAVDVGDSCCCFCCFCKQMLFFIVDGGEGCCVVTVEMDFMVESLIPLSRRNCSFKWRGTYSFPFFRIRTTFFGFRRTTFGWPREAVLTFRSPAVTSTPTCEACPRVGLEGAFRGGTGSGAIIRFGFPLFEIHVGNWCTWSF